MLGSYTPCFGFEPAVATVASGSSSATEWYRRGNLAKPAPPGLADDHDPVAGSNRSAPRVAVVASSLTREPPCTKSFPFGRSTEFPSTRGPEGMSPILTQAGLGLDRSIISVVAVAGFLTPPRIITRAA